MEKLLFYELATEYGPLYIYERYSDEFEKIPETREFFTQEIGTRGYGTLSFMGNAVFRARERSMEGLVREEYMQELTPYEFLNKVFAYLENSEQKETKKAQVYNIFKMQAENKDNTRPILKELKPTEEQKNKIATKILKRYL